MIVLITGVLLIKAPTYHDNGFCDMIIILAILLHITTGENAIKCIFSCTDVSVMAYQIYTMAHMITKPEKMRLVVLHKHPIVGVEYLP